MKTIQLTKGFITVVDDEDYLNLVQYSWHPLVQYRTDGSVRNVYAIKGHTLPNGKRTTQRMHRVIMDVIEMPDIQVDHYPDHYGLNNRRSNLRLATASQNAKNSRLRTCNSSGFKGVCWSKANHNFIASIGVDGKYKYIGCYANAIDAARAYDAAATTLQGKFACTNKDLGLL